MSSLFLLDVYGFVPLSVIIAFVSRNVSRCIFCHWQTKSSTDFVSNFSENNFRRLCRLSWLVRLKGGISQWYDFYTMCDTENTHHRSTVLKWTHRYLGMQFVLWRHWGHSIAKFRAVHVSLFAIPNSMYYPENTNLRGIIDVQLTSCLNGFDLTKQVKLLFIQHLQSSLIQTK